MTLTDDPAPGSHARVSVAIQRPDDGSILILCDGVLPSFDLDARSPWQVVPPVNDEMLERLGLAITTLRAVPGVLEALARRLASGEAGR